MSPSPPRGRRASDEALLSRRRRRVHRRARLRRHRVTLLLVFGVIAAAPLVLVTVGVTATVAFRSSCHLSSLRPAAIGQNSFVYAADGSLLGSIPAERNRQPVPLREISAWMAKATVSTEDRRFYKHGGVDYEGIARALWRDVRAGRVVEGGSTITQQLVRNLYISREVTVARKIKEACLAIKLSRAWTKDRILAAYMNQVYFGNHAYGVEAAAQTYFSRHARDLTLLQSALLAGLPQAPSVYDPFSRSADALARREVVLRAMLESGDITQAQFERAIAHRTLDLEPGRLYTRIREPYFFSYVRDQLLEQYGSSTVRSGGLRVFTTINPRLQVAARKAIRETLYLRTDPAAALVAIDPATGAIRAMTAVTPGRKGNQFNLVAQARRQSGSSFKTFVLAAAVAQGINPDTTTYISAPFHYQPDPRTPAWDVSTYSHTYLGAVSIRSATLASDNTVYAQLTLDVGPENVAAMAKKLGVRTPLEPVPSIGLGSIAVSPLDMASAYATLAAGGVYSKPMAIRKVILANGNEDTDAGWGKPQRRRIIPDGVAWEVTRILEQNVYHGTGVGAYFGRPAAGKTGTTDNHADAWFSGYTPTLEGTVWVGYPRAEIPMENVHGIAVAGGTFPATIWKLFMEQAVGSRPVVEWTPPKHYPVWKPFSRGQYAIRYAPTTETTSSTATEPTTATRPASATKTPSIEQTTATRPAKATKPSTASGTPAAPVKKVTTQSHPTPARTVTRPATTAPPPVTTEPVPASPEPPLGATVPSPVATEPVPATTEPPPTPTEPPPTPTEPPSTPTDPGTPQ